MTTFQPALESQTLSQKMAVGRMPAGEALRIALQVAEELQRLHDEGRVHGALSPSSIATSGRDVYLLPAGDAMSGVPYMSPEAAQGSTPDARSDIFSFGAILFEMLTGERAFRPDAPHVAPRVGVLRFASYSEHVNRVEVGEAQVLRALADLLLQRVGVIVQLDRAVDRVIAELREDAKVLPQLQLGPFLERHVEYRDGKHPVQRHRERAR